MEGGKATKRTRYGAIVKDRFERTVRSAKLCLKNNLTYHVIDAESKLNYLMEDEATELVALSEGLTTILTFSCKHINSLRIMRQTLRSIHDTDRIGVCLVVGNSAFLNWREIRRPTLRTVEDSVKFLRDNFGSIPIMIGTEGIASSALELTGEFSLIPFLLYDSKLDNRALSFKKDMPHMKVAVYVPYLISENLPRLLHDVLYRLSGYILRRRWVQTGLKELKVDISAPALKAIIQEKGPLPTRLANSPMGNFLAEASKRLAVYGTHDIVAEEIRRMKELGIDIIVGLPIKENEEQVCLFSNCLKAGSVS